MVKLTIQGKQSSCCVLPKKREEKNWKCSPPTARSGTLQSKQKRVYDRYYYSSYSQLIISIFYQKIYSIRDQTKKLYLSQSSYIILIIKIGTIFDLKITKTPKCQQDKFLGC